MSNKMSNKMMSHKGGAIYSFDLNDKIGGLPARIPLNGTRDGDCPASDTKDLGFVNYGLTRGGSRRRRGGSSKRRSMKRRSGTKRRSSSRRSRGGSTKRRTSRK